MTHTEPQCLEKARPEMTDAVGMKSEKDRTEPKDVLKHGKKTIQMFAFFALAGDGVSPKHCLGSEAP